MKFHFLIPYLNANSAGCVCGFPPHKPAICTCYYLEKGAISPGAMRATRFDLPPTCGRLTRIFMGKRPVLAPIIPPRHDRALRKTFLLLPNRENAEKKSGKYEPKLASALGYYANPTAI